MVRFAVGCAVPAVGYVRLAAHCTVTDPPDGGPIDVVLAALTGDAATD